VGKSIQLLERKGEKMNYDFIKPNLPAGDFRSCFALSVHKCGSTLMHAMIQQVCEKALIPNLSIPDRLFNKGIGIGSEWNTDPDLRALISEGYIYFGFRHFPTALKDDICAENVKSVLLVRDPRDALVSQYFSLKPGGSHVLPKENTINFVTKSNENDDIAIDKYVLSNVKNIKDKLSQYRENLNFSNVIVFKYEDIFFDKYMFLKAIFEHFNISVEDSILHEVATKNDIIPKKEDTSKHIRKGIPGDYKDKLTQDTIEKLNFQLNDVALFYGYNLLS
jgi:hypothetical protein